MTANTATQMTMTWKLRDSRDVVLAPYLSGTVLRVRVAIDGKVTDDTYLETFATPRGPGGVVHGSIGSLGLTQDRLAEVKAWLTEVRIELDKAPEARFHRLVEQRESLAREHWNAIDAQYRADHDRIERAMRGRDPGKSDLSARIESATAALKEFDAKYPEIIAEVIARRDAETMRRMENY